MFCYNKASGFDTNYAVINSKRFFFIFSNLKPLAQKKKKLYGVSFVHEFVLCSFHKRAEIYLIHQAKRTKAGFHWSPEGLWFGLQTISQKGSLVPGWDENSVSASEGRAALPSPKHTLGKQTSAVPLPGCRFYERGESGIPKITEEVRHIFGCQNTLQTKRWTASRRQAVAFPENQMLSCEGIECRLCSRHQCLCWNVGEVREN